MPTDLPDDLIAAVYDAASKYPDHPAITAPGKRSGRPGKTISYRDLAAGIESTAAGLRRDGFGPGERLLFSVRPGPAAFTLALAAVRAGGAIVFIDPGGWPRAVPEQDRAGVPAVGGLRVPALCASARAARSGPLPGGAACCFRITAPWRSGTTTPARGFLESR